MKCTLCGQRKGRRFCPAKSSTICAQCCGEKRVLEIDCPESCEYLKVGSRLEARQEGVRHFRAADPIEQEKRARVLTDFEPVIVDLQTLIGVERQSSRDLRDADVAEALDCLLKTLRTEERGVIYETTSNNLRADALRRQFSSIIESYRHPEETDRLRIHLRHAIECLEVLRAVVASHMAASPSALSFVDFLARRLGRGGRTAPQRPSIIVPGR